MGEQNCGLQFPRSGCALQGATEAIRAVEGFVPVLHSTAGCGLRDADGQTSAWLPGRLAGAEVPSTALLERQVIYGGASRLREQVRNTLKILSGDLYLIVPGCPAGMIGDDIDFIVREMSQSGYPVMKVDTAGYRGTAPVGYAQFAVDVLDYVRKEPAGQSEPQARPVVNIWGVVPGVDPYWEGDIAELTELLEMAGLRVTRLFGFGSGLGEWQLAPAAAFNLSVSPWGKQVAEWANKTFGTPFLELPGLPVGAEQEQEAVLAVSAALGLDEELRPLLQDRQARFLHALSHASADYVRYGFQKTFAVVSDSARAFSLLRFLQETAGYLPRALVLTDVAPKSVPEQVRSACDSLGVPLLVSDDNEEIENLLLQKRPELILGSVLEQRVAEELGALLVEYSYPQRTTVILESGSTGRWGTLHLLEHLFALQKTHAVRKRDALPALRIV